MRLKLDVQNKTQLMLGDISPPPGGWINMSFVSRQPYNFKVHSSIFFDLKG